jgi:hypothetical protein
VNLDGLRIRRLLYLIPDLWPDDHPELFHHLSDLETLGDLVERRTAVRPTFGMEPIWAITVPASKRRWRWMRRRKPCFWSSMRPDHWHRGCDSGSGRGLRLAIRLKKIEAKLWRKEDVPKLLIVLEAELGV